MKNLRNYFSIAIVLSLVIGMASCGKYEEGPAISLRSKKARVANEWKVDKAEDENGDDVTENFQNSTFTFEKDGTYRATSSFGGATFSIDGEWAFVNDKEGIETSTSYEIGGTTYTSTSTATILKLKEKEMWLVDDSSKVEVHYVPN